MPDPQFDRPPGWRFAFEGINLRDFPDAIGPTKFASATNIRATARQSVQTRPGYVPLFNVGAADALTDLKAYATLNTDDTPRFLARTASDGIFLDDGTGVGTLAAPVGSGVKMLPFRPGGSPQSWMYIAGLSDYVKLSAPDSGNNVQQWEVGIAEPQASLEAAPNQLGFYPFTSLAAQWGATGTASAPTDGTRTSDTAGIVIADPVNPLRWSVQVNGGVSYAIGQLLTVAATNPAEVQDVIPPIATTAIQAIYYNSGSAGHCTIVPGQIPVAEVTPGVPGLGSLRRGALVELAGSEIVMVLDVTTGPDGSVCFETVTTGSYTAATSIIGISTIVLTFSAGVAQVVNSGDGLISSLIETSVAVGIGTIQQALPVNPFVQGIGGGTLPQQDDYIHASIYVDNAANLNEIRLIFNVDSESSPTYVRNILYYAIQPSAFAGVEANTETQVEALLGELIQSTSGVADLPEPTVGGQGQWTEVMIPLTALTRLGGDQNRTLAQCNGIQVLVNANATVNVFISSLWVGGGGQPDIGDTGAEYKYRIVPRSSSTGAKGNPSPEMRYGVSPRRQPVIVDIPASYSDPQVDFFDVYRYGGSITSYRFIGTIQLGNTEFFDDYFDDAAQGGGALESDNFEPWPSVDLPFVANTAAAGGTAIISIAGTFIQLSGVTFPVTITRWLPGTLLQFFGATYTLRERPTISSGICLFEVQECIGPNVNTAYLLVQEPVLARQILPYVWGPDVNGTFFGVGDTLRPGTISFAKSNNPDSAPDSYNLDLCPPSEPLIGGIIKGGVSLGASTSRWWAFYPNFSSAQRYNPIEQPVGRGLISPYGYCTDGAIVYFWAKDGICITDGGPFKSLTDEDLYNLFPHEGVGGSNVVRNGVTYYAPDYSRAVTFRLAKVNQYLYADYQDSTGTPRTLVCDLRTGGWVQDIYNDPIICHYQPEQQSGGLNTNAGTLYPSNVMSDENGFVWQEQDCTGDNGVTIKCLVAPFEWDGGDLRAQPLFGDSYLDCVPRSQVTVTPVSQGGSICPPTVIPAGTGGRVFQPISIIGGELQKFVGLQIEWEE